jgi:hypothetical protein
MQDLPTPKEDFKLTLDDIDDKSMSAKVQDIAKFILN